MRAARNKPDGRSSSSLSPVGGRLRLFWQVWDSLGVEPWVVQVNHHGYSIPWESQPPLSRVPVAFNSYQPGSDRFMALQDAVAAMISKEAVELAPDSPGFYSRMFIVPKSTGGWRPIIDLSPLNQFVRKTKFKMETPKTVLLALRQGDWMVSLDLKDAYFHVPIHQASRQFLRFVWEGRSYQFRALCFGLSTAPQVFTRVMAPVSLLCHQRGIRLLRYIDDWLIVADSAPDLQSQTTWLLELCQRLGLLVNLEKSELQPSRRRGYLGMDLDSSEALARPSQARVRKFLSLLRLFLASDVHSARSWLRVIGHMVSLEKLVPTARGRIRSAQWCLRDAWRQSTDSPFSPVALTDTVRKDLLWWSDPANLLVGMPFHEAPPDLHLYSDASHQGWGAHLLDLQAAGIWGPQDRRCHINLLELRAVWLGLQAFRDSLVGTSVVAMSDNTTVVAYIRNQGGTHSRSLCDETLQLLQWAREHQVSLTARHIPGWLNAVADSLSRKGQVLPSEWTLHQDVCRKLWRVWGYPHVDLFATALTSRLPLYVSPVHDPQAWAVDALSLDWSNLEAYAYPPLALIRRVLNKVRASSNLHLTLVAPKWPQREWYPDLLDLLVDFPRVLPRIRRLLKQPGMDRFHENLASLSLHAWRLSSDPSARKAFRSRLPAESRGPSGRPPPTSTSPSGRSSAAGCVSNVSIATMWL